MNVASAILLLTDLLRQANTLGQAINAARAEGREDLTDEEVAAFRAKDDAARERLENLIKQIL